MLELIGAGVAVVATVAGYMNSRRFVRTRLRFVDAIHRRRAPWLAGAGATLLALPLAWLLPAVGAGTALLVGTAVGTGVAHGARDVRRREGRLLEE
jgi:hypothetical protein